MVAVRGDGSSVVGPIPTAPGARNGGGGGRRGWSVSYRERERSIDQERKVPSRSRARGTERPVAG
jgi:hypothetical protein